MKIDFDEHPGALVITSYAEGWIRIGERRIDSACVVTPSEIRLDILPERLEHLDQRHVDALLALAPEIVLLGTGPRQRFIDYPAQHLLAQRGVGLEIMDTGAACRSYNVLVAEHRAVIAALFML